MRAGLALVILMGVAGCMDDGPDPSDPQGRSASQLSDQREDCEADGGQFVTAGLGGLTCVRPTSDAGQSCSRDSDCEDLCLADAGPANAPDDPTATLQRLAQSTPPAEEGVMTPPPMPTSGVCSAQSPTFGCHMIFRDDGEVTELCID
ncbi:MAG: hypothetical protein P8X50_02585 [Maritimibacter sp.]